MKSRMFTLAIAAAATLVALVLASVGGATNQATVKVADVTDVGGLNDKGFNHLSYVGLVKAEKQLGIQGRVYISNTAADRKPNLQAAAQAGYGLVVGLNGGWTMALAVSLSAGQIVEARQTLGGVPSALSPAVVVVAPPPPPVLDSPRVAGDAQITGSGLSGAGVEVFTDAHAVGSTSVNPDFTWALPVAPLEAVSLGVTYQAKRAEVAGRFAALIQGYLDEAAAEGSIAPLDTRVATLAWLGAVNEVVIQWLHGNVEDLRATVTPLTRILLRSIGALA